ncbi:MAG: DNA polymerase IV [Thermoplasmata archaeon]|nr:DNA polymerase IV [Thermoplasmata archaeon]
MRWVLYVDMDAFYVSCELRDRPELVGKPVIVGPDPKQGHRRGVVLSASYEARAFGVKSAMPATAADRLCPNAHWVSANFEKYGRLSGEVRTVLNRHSPAVLPLSIDEAALSIELPEIEAATSLARTIQAELRDTLQLPSSWGVATDRWVAKIATDLAKPAGVRAVSPEQTVEFLRPLPVRAVPGVGPKTEERLRLVGVERIGQLAEVPRRDLVRAVGSFADELRQLARGEHVDRREESAGPRSRSTDETFGQDITVLPTLETATSRLARGLAESLTHEKLRYGTVTVGLRWSDFNRSQHSRTLGASREGSAALEQVATQLLRELWGAEQAGAARGVRTLSVGVERLSPARTRAVPLDAFAS